MGYLKFKDLGEYGRLGNQLFQYAALKGIAKKKGLTPVIPDLTSKVWHGQRCLLNEFDISCEVEVENRSAFSAEVYEPFPVGYYHPQVEEQVRDGVSLKGFFQNTMYFSNIEDEIKQELLPKQQYLDDAKAYIESIREGREVVSLHLRRGDVTDKNNNHPIIYGETPFDEQYMWGKYFKKVVNDLSKYKRLEDYLFFVFVGGSTTGNDFEDIEWAKKHFPYKNFYISDSNDPMIDFSRILCCDINILSPVSTFSWWTAYLNPKNNKKVFAPLNYHLDNTTQYRKGFYPEEWILL